MPFSVSIRDRMNWGNVRAVVYKLTDVQSGGNTFNPGFTRIRKVQAVNQTDLADTFKETFSNSTGLVTVTSVTNDDDGYILVVGE